MANKKVPGFIDKAVEIDAVRGLTTLAESSPKAADFEITALANPAAVPQDGWKKGKLQWKELSPVSPADNIEFLSVFADASDVAALFNVTVDVKPAAKVEKIVAINYVDEGRTEAKPEAKQLWVMDSFAHALSSKWSRSSEANRAAKGIKDLPSLTKIEQILPEVTYFLFCTENFSGTN